MIHGVRPARPRAPIAVAAMVIGTWWLVAHNSGAGWVQVMGDIVFGVLAIGVFGPAAILAVARIRVTAAATDGTAGLPVELKVDASTRLRVRPVDPPGPDGFAGPVRRPRATRSTARTADGRGDGVTLLPIRRGVHATVTLDIATAAPFGMQWWTRRVVLPVPAVLHVGPRRGQPVAWPHSSEAATGDGRRRAAADTGEPRGARPYRPGDRQRQVHWPVTAHAGELMVREMEEPIAEPVTVRVALPVDPDAAERVAERAMATVLMLLGRDQPVLLATDEPAGAVCDPVTDRTSASRRLARAVAPQSGSAAVPPGRRVLDVTA